jgi:hypothetical protein
MAIADRSMKLIRCNDVTAWYSSDEFTSRLTHVGPCSALSSAAEKELASFYSAVKELFGPTAAHKAAEVWLHVLEAEELDPDFMHRGLRVVTTKAMKEFVRSTWPVF